MRGISRTSRMVRWCARTSACRVVGAPERRLARMPSTDTWAAAARGVLLRGKIRNGPILIFPFRTTPHGSLQRAGLRRESGRPVPFDLHGRPKRHEPRSKDRESPRHLVTVLGDIGDVKAVRAQDFGAEPYGGEDALARESRMGLEDLLDRLACPECFEDGLDGDASALDVALRQDTTAHLPRTARLTRPPDCRVPTASSTPAAHNVIFVYCIPPSRYHGSMAILTGR